uniref:Ras-related GTP-binding protein C-like n=1 Tax=Hirondellea gigas TaxID=1518452 RepID=A0A2P2I0M8_9CRUS
MSSYEGDEDDGYMASYQPAEYGSSFPGNQPLNADGPDNASGFATDEKAKILLMGLRRSGKSSIQNVVFHKMSPNETLFLESTNKITTDDISNTSCVQFQILDFPGQIDFFDPSFDTEKIFGGVGALVYVIDAQDDYLDAVSRLGETVSRVYKINPKLKFEVLIHKVDGLTDDTKIETQRDIHQRAFDELHESAVGIPGLENVHLNFHLTSIYDHSIFEAFSKVVQKLIPELPHLENLLNFFNTNSGIEKAFLFDVSSKIYIATDYSPVDMQSYELCCDMIDVVLDISYIYGLEEDSADHMSCFDSSTYSVIKLNNNTVLLLWEVSRYLALVCILREENYCRPGLIEYNYHCFRKGLQEILAVRNKYLRLEQQELKQKSKQNVHLFKNGQIEGEDAVDAKQNSEQRSIKNRLNPISPQTSTPIRGVTAAENTTNGTSFKAMAHTSSMGAAAPEPSGSERAVRAENSTDGNSAAVSAATVGVGRLSLSSDSSTVVRAGTTQDSGGFPTRTAEAVFSGAVVNNGRRGGATATAEGGYRTTSEYTPSRAKERGQLRHASSTPVAPVRELVQGHVIHSGGGVTRCSNVAATGVAAVAPEVAVQGVVGNTYVMTDDAGMVLVNGSVNS